MKIRLLVRLFAFLMFVSGVGFVCGASYLQRSLPRHSIEETKNVIPRNIHGAFVYGTQPEWVAYDALFYGMLAFGAASALLAERQRRTGDRKALGLRGDDRF